MCVSVARRRAFERYDASIFLAPVSLSYEMGIYSQQHAAAASPGYTPLTEQVQEEQVAADASVDTPVVASHLRTANDRPWVWSLMGNLLAVFVAGAIAASKQSTSTNNLSVRS